MRGVMESKQSPSSFSNKADSVSIEAVLCSLACFSHSMLSSEGIEIRSNSSIPHSWHFDVRKLNWLYSTVPVRSDLFLSCHSKESAGLKLNLTWLLVVEIPNSDYFGALKIG